MTDIHLLCFFLAYLQIGSQLWALLRFLRRDCWLWSEQTWLIFWRFIRGRLNDLLELQILLRCPQPIYHFGWTWSLHLINWYVLVALTAFSDYPQFNTKLIHVSITFTFLTFFIFFTRLWAWALRWFEITVFWISRRFRWWWPRWDTLYLDHWLLSRKLTLASWRKIVDFDHW